MSIRIRASIDLPVSEVLALAYARESRLESFEFQSVSGNIGDSITVNFEKREDDAR